MWNCVCIRCKPRVQLEYLALFAMFASFPLKMLIKVLDCISGVCVCDYVRTFVECALFFFDPKEIFHFCRTKRNIFAKRKLVFRTNDSDTLLPFHSFDGNKSCERKVRVIDSQNKNEYLTMLWPLNFYKMLSIPNCLFVNINKNERNVCILWLPSMVECKHCERRNEMNNFMELLCSFEYDFPALVSIIIENHCIHAIQSH